MIILAITKDHDVYATDVLWQDKPQILYEYVRNWCLERKLSLDIRTIVCTQFNGSANHGFQTFKAGKDFELLKFKVYTVHKESLKLVYEAWTLEEAEEASTNTVALILDSYFLNAKVK